MSRSAVEILNAYQTLDEQEQRHQRKIQKIKLAIYTINVFLFILACLGAGLGVYALLQYKVLYLEDLVDGVPMVTAILWLFPVSSVVCILLIPMCGCHGVLSRKEGLIVTYFVFLLLLLLMALVLCVLAVVGADMIAESLKNSISAAVRNYPAASAYASRLGLDQIQTVFDCCGAEHGVQDFGQWGPPPSCKKRNFFRPCNHEVFEYRDTYRYSVVGCSAFVALVLLVGMILCMTLIRYSRKLAHFDRAGKLDGFDNINYIAEVRNSGTCRSGNAATQC